MSAAAVQQDAPIKAFAVMEAGGKVQDWEYVPLPLADDEVELEIEACGVCHSDLNQQTNFWGGANFPLVVGHEIIGTVSKVGAGVEDLKLAQRVGVSPQSGHCAECSRCKRGQDQLCGKIVLNYNSPTRDPAVQPYTYGGFAYRTRVKAKWAFPIPDELDPADAAPLLCAGLTTWSPFVQHSIKAGDLVGVVGIGGLGHLALQFANKLGAKVTAITRTADKEAEAKKFGAQSVLVTSDENQVAQHLGTFDFILSTVSSNNVDWDQYFSLLSPGGKLVLVGLPTKVTFNPMGLVMRQLEFSGSFLCSNADIRSMLEFCAKHNIVAQTEKLKMTAENATLALEKIGRNEPRYRMVLVNEDHPNFLAKKAAGQQQQQQQQ